MLSKIILFKYENIFLVGNSCIDGPILVLLGFNSTDLL